MVDGLPSGDDLQRWRDGVLLMAKPKNSKSRSVISPSRAREGVGANQPGCASFCAKAANGEIKRVAKHIGHPVIKLKRVRMGQLKLADLPNGQWRHLTDKEVNELKK